MRKNIKVDGRDIHAFILVETDERICYIPVSALHRVDYDRLEAVSKIARGPIMETLRDYKLDNGRNALKQYDNLIQVTIKSGEDSVRIPKPDESTKKKDVTVEAKVDTPEEAPKARRKPGPKPKAKE